MFQLFYHHSYEFKAELVFSFDITHFTLCNKILILKPSLSKFVPNKIHITNISSTRRQVSINIPSQ